MVADKISIEEHIAALKTKSFEDQMRVVTALFKGLAEAKASVTKPYEGVDSSRRSDILDSQNEPILGLTPLEVGTSPNKPDEINPSWRAGTDWDPKAELAKISKAHREKYGEVGDSWKELAGAWKDSTPDNLIELIRTDRGPEKEPPSFDE